jgi:large subunit ribosomal protein L14
MIYKITKLFLADNSGPKKAKSLDSKKIKTSYLTDIITIVIKKKFLKKKKIKKNILKAIIINTKFKTKRLNSFYITFNKNRILLLNHNLVFLGTNIKSLLCKEIKLYKKQFKKIISYSSGNI